MSGGYKCSCEESKKPVVKERRWFVMQRECNHSAFNGYHYTPSRYSSIICVVCIRSWRTRARYVDDLKDYDFTKTDEKQGT
jgi:hypothetical protein